MVYVLPLFRMPCVVDEMARREVCRTVAAGPLQE
jgi:hypothetical protein